MIVRFLARFTCGRCGGSSTDVPVDLPAAGEPMPEVRPPSDWGSPDLGPAVMDAGVLCPTCLAELARWFGQVEEPRR